MCLDLAGFHVLDYFRPACLGGQLSHLGRPLYRAAIGAGEVGFGLFTATTWRRFRPSTISGRTKRVPWNRYLSSGATILAFAVPFAMPVMSTHRTVPHWHAKHFSAGVAFVRIAVRNGACLHGRAAYSASARRLTPRRVRLGLDALVLAVPCCSTGLAVVVAELALSRT